MHRGIGVLCTAALVLTTATFALGAQAETVAHQHAAAQLSPEQQHQLVPAYFYPSGTNRTNPWHRICRSMSSRGISSIAIMNPNAGPGGGREQAYTEAISYCHQRHQKVIGYISTNYAGMPLSTVLSYIDDYYAWYHVDGIFLDEMSNFPTYQAGDGSSVLSYFRKIYVHVKQKHGRGTTVIGNPGAPAATAWQLSRPVADIVVIFEDNDSVYQERTPPAWVHRYPANRIGALVEQTTADRRHHVCALSRARNTGWIDVTTDWLPNSWDTLPSYWPLVAPQCR